MPVRKVLVGVLWKSQVPSLQVIFDELVFQRYFLASSDKQIAPELDGKDLSTSSKHNTFLSLFALKNLYKQT